MRESNFGRLVLVGFGFVQLEPSHPTTDFGVVKDVSFIRLQTRYIILLPCSPLY